ncbi:hypothetical protein [Nakamurella lactea]|uniref:hypothetical protein n=1 Tax=Nakamurella lactea TaxID=459515 RepID=UPI00041E14A0|nr:hypothetical protein [Nakamurella lactea]
MTEIGELTETIELNPDAPQPPFPLYLELPSSWTLLDTNPATWERSAQNMLDTTFHRSKLSARERREVLGFFDQLVADCQQAGAALSLIQVGRLAAGGAASLGIHLAFGDEGRPASLASVQDSLPRNGITTEVGSGVGPALMHSERMTMVPPGATELAALTSIQIFVPIPGTTWTAVFATASAFPELTDPVERLLRAIVASFRREPEPNAAVGQPTDETPPESDDPAEFTELPKGKGPGIERGFTTLVRKRIDPGDDHSGSAGGAAES